MSFHLRYGEPDWNEPPCHCQEGHGPEIRQHPLSDKSYEELRYEATQKQWITNFVDLNTMALSSWSPTAAFVNLRNLTDTVEVIVGEGDDQARWVLHSSLLTNDSEFASMALSRDFKEKSERLIRFPEEDPGIFGQYVTFLYAKMVFVFALETLVQMYTLGDRLQSIKFANACYESIAKTTDPYSAFQIKYIFDDTCSDDRLRKLFISQVGKGILDGRYSFSIPHEQEMLKDLMPELMVGVTAEVQKRKSGGDRWYPRPQSSETRSGFSLNTPPSGPAPASAFGVPITTAASGSGAGLYDWTRPAANVGGPFGTGGSLPSSTTTGGGLFGGQRSNSTFAGGLIGGSNSNPGTAISSNPFGAPSTSTPAAGTGGGLFNRHQHPSQSTSSLFGGNTGVSLSSNHQNQPQSAFSLLGNTSRNQQQAPSGGLFGRPIPSHQGSANEGNDTGNLSSSRTHGIVHGFGQPQANATQTGSTPGTSSLSPAHTANTTQSSSIAPSVFNNTSTASPSAAVPAPHGPPVFGFLPTSQTQTHHQHRNFTPSFSFGSPASTSASDAPRSEPKMWTVRNDSSQPQCLSSSSSRQNGTLANTNDHNGEHDQPTGDASSLAALDKASAINNPTRGFVPYTTSNFAPSNGLKFGTSAFDQIISGKSHADGPSPFGQRVKGWRPAENGKPSGFGSSQDVTDGHENGNKEGKGKERALDDAALSTDLINMAFPGSQSLTQSEDLYLQNAQGGKITKDDKLDADFGEYLKRASQENAKDDGDEAQEMASESKDQHQTLDEAPGKDSENAATPSSSAGTTTAGLTAASTSIDRESTADLKMRNLLLGFGARIS